MRNMKKEHKIGISSWSGRALESVQISINLVKRVVLILVAPYFVYFFFFFTGCFGTIEDCKIRNDIFVPGQRDCL